MPRSTFYSYSYNRGPQIILILVRKYVTLGIFCSENVINPFFCRRNGICYSSFVFWTWIFNGFSAETVESLLRRNIYNIWSVLWRFRMPTIRFLLLLLKRGNNLYYWGGELVENFSWEVWYGSVWNVFIFISTCS